jgi:hypothetical protein
VILDLNMNFRFEIVIERSMVDVFRFFRDIHKHAGKEGTVVPVYDKLTPGQVNKRTRYREVVQVTPFMRGEILSEVTCYEEGRRLGYQFSGLGLDGELNYSFFEVAAGTRVIQEQSLRPRGLLKIFSFLIKEMFSKAAGKRLESIRILLERENET